MEGGSQTQDHGQAIYAKIRYSVSSTFATGCSSFFLVQRGGGVGPPKVFLNFVQDDKISAPDVFSSCSFIPQANLSQNFYGYEI